MIKSNRAVYFVSGKDSLVMILIELMNKSDNSKQYLCLSCSYLYDPETYAEENKLNEPIEFEKLPDDWLCPYCDAGKDAFEEITFLTHDEKANNES